MGNPAAEIIKDELAKIRARREAERGVRSGHGQEGPTTEETR